MTISPRARPWAGYVARRARIRAARTAETDLSGWLIGLIGMSTLLGPLSLDFYLPALPEISADLAAPTSQMQLSLSTTLVGLAVGQLAVGQISDRLGRRTPLLAGLGIFIVTSALCGLAPNIETFLGLRFLQGLAGSVGMVTALAIVRDRCAGTAAASVYSTMVLFTSLGPLIGPQLGALVLQWGSWRLLFHFLALAAAALLLLMAIALPETLPPQRRHFPGHRNPFGQLGRIARDRLFVVYTGTGALAVGSTFAYLSGSSFVFQENYGVSPSVFALIFALNAVGLLVGSQVNRRLVRSFAPTRLLTFGVWALAAAGCVYLASVLLGVASAQVAFGCCWFGMFAIGFVVPNSTALALTEFGWAAGTAASLIGFVRYALGAAVAPLIGLAGARSEVPMAAAMAGLGLAACALNMFGPRSAGRTTNADKEPTG